jgi:hypothetical protein
MQWNDTRILLSNFRIQASFLMAHDLSPKVQRRKGPTKKQWSQVKDRFFELYLSEDPPYTIAEIKDILALELAFFAEEHSYKYRIKQWKVFRNLKRAEAERLAAEDLACLATGAPSPPRHLNHRIINATKIDRHTRRRRRATMISNVGEPPMMWTTSDEEGTTPKDVSTVVQYQGTFEPVIPTIRFISLGATGDILPAIERWHHEYLNNQLTSGSSTDSGELPIFAVKHRTYWEWMYCILEGLATMHVGFKRNMKAVDYFNKACDGFYKSVSDPSCTLMIELVRVFCFSRWRCCPHFRAEVLRHFTEIADTKLDRGNPLVTFLRGLQNVAPAAFPELRSSSRKLLYGIAEQSIWTRRTRFTEVYSRLCSIKNDDCDNVEGAKYLAALVSKMQMTLGSRHENVLWSTADLARAQLISGNYAAATLNAMDIIDVPATSNLGEDLEQRILHSHNEKHLAYRALDILCLAERNVHNHAGCVFWAKLCFEWAVRKQLIETNILNSLESLEDALISDKQWTILRQVWQQHPQLHEKMPDRLKLFQIAEDSDDFVVSNDRVRTAGAVVSKL